MENHVKCLRDGDIATLISENRAMEKSLDEIKVEVKGMAKIYDLIYELTTNVSVLAGEMTRMNSDLSAVRSDVETIKKQPANDFNHYKKLIIGGVITAILGAIIGAFLKGIIG